MLKVWVTGSNGILGTAFCNVLKEKYEIFSTGHELDISNSDLVKDFSDTIKPNYIINCAAYTNVDLAEKDRDTAWKTNVIGPENIAIAAKKWNATAVHFSTDYVFDGTKKSYIDNDAASPLNYYGLTKFNGSRKFCQANDNYKLIRTSWLFSEHGNNFVKTMLKLFSEKSEVKVVHDQVGCPTYAPYLALKTVEVLESKTQYDIFNITNAGSVSWYNFAVKIYEISCDLNLITNTVNIIPIKTDELQPKRAAIRPKNSVLDTSRIKALTGELVSWEDSLYSCLLKIKNGK